MDVVNLKTVQAYAREVNDHMKSLTHTAATGEFDLANVLTTLIGDLAVLSAMVEQLADFLLDQAQ